MPFVPIDTTHLRALADTLTVPSQAETALDLAIGSWEQALKAEGCFERYKDDVVSSCRKAYAMFHESRNASPTHVRVNIPEIAKALETANRRYARESAERAAISAVAFSEAEALRQLKADPAKFLDGFCPGLGAIATATTLEQLYARMNEAGIARDEHLARAEARGSWRGAQARDLLDLFRSLYQTLRAAESRTKKPLYPSTDLYFATPNPAERTRIAIDFIVDALLKRKGWDCRVSTSTWTLY